MTLQEILDRVWQKFVVEGSPWAGKPGVVDEDPTCYYRSPGGGCCFIGACIPDDRYRKVLEGKAVSHILVTEAIGGSEANPDVLRGLQRIHDIYDPNEGRDWKAYCRNRLTVFAAEQGLTVPA